MSSVGQKFHIKCKLQLHVQEGKNHEINENPGDIILNNKHHLGNISGVILTWLTITDGDWFNPAFDYA